MTAPEIIAELKTLGSDSIKRVLTKHGAREPFYGVKIEDLKKVLKRVKGDTRLALDLYDTGISDAMYLAGLMADGAEMTKKDLQRWADQAYWSMISECTVPWVASENPHGQELALKWIESNKENVAAAGWMTLAALVAVKEDAELDLHLLKKLLQRVGNTIPEQPDRVRLVMNCFVIAVGGYVKSLTQLAIDTAKKIGKVEVDMNGTACKVPYAPDYLKMMKDRGKIGQKRKTAKC
jgi:3-methyladenine DNA glycosylase AlkD